MGLCLFFVLLCKPLYTVKDLPGSEIAGDDICKPRHPPAVAAKEDSPAPVRAQDPDVPRVALAAAAGAARDPDLDLGRERLIPEQRTNGFRKDGGVLVAVPAPVRAEKGLHTYQDVPVRQSGFRPTTTVQADMARMAKDTFTILFMPDC